MSGTVDAGKLLIQVEATTENLRRQLNDALSAVNDAARGMQASVSNVNKSFDSMGDAVDGALKGFTKFISGINPLAGGLASVVTGGTAAGIMLEKLAEKAGEYAAEIVKAGDQHTAFIAQLTALTGSADLAAEAFDKLEAQSASTGTALSTSIDMFKKFTVASGEIGATGDQVQSLIKTIQEAGVVSGSTAQQIDTVASGISVAFEQGHMNARQFRTILTEMPALAKDMADALGLSVGQMSQMAKQGTLTGEAIETAIGGAASKIDDQFAKMPVTMSRAYDSAQVGIEQFNVAIDKTFHISQAIAGLWQAIGTAAAAAAQGVLSATGNVDSMEKNFEKIRDLTDQLAWVQGQIAKNPQPNWMERQLGVPTVDDLLKQQADLNAKLAPLYDERSKMVMDSLHAQQKADDDANDQYTRNFKATQEAATDKLKLEYDKRAAAKKKYDDDMAALDKAAANIQIDPSMDAATKAQKLADIHATATEVGKKYADTLEQIAKSEEHHDKAAEAAAKKMEEVVDSTARAAEEAQKLLEVHKQGTAAIQEQTTMNDAWNKVAEAGIPDTDDLTDAQWKMRDAIVANVTAQQSAIDAMKNYDEAQKQQTEALKKYGEEIQHHAEQIANDVSTAFFDALTNDRKGSTFVDYFKTLFKRIAVEALSANIVLPITTQIVGSMPGLFGVSQPGGGGTGGAGQVIGTINSAGQLVAGSSADSGGGMFGGLSNALGLANLSDSLGITGLKNTISGWLGSGTGGAGIFSPTGSIGGILSTPIGGSGLFGPTVSGAPLAGGTTLGGLLGGAGAGFAAGSLLNSLVGGKPLGGNIGSATGAIAGAAIGSIVPGIGTLIGGLIGGAAGGGLGGLIGPGPKHMAWDVEVQGQGGQLGIAQARGSDTAALKSAVSDATAGIQQFNQIMQQYGITVSGMMTMGGGNRVAQAGTFAAGLNQLQFQGPAGTSIATALAHMGGQITSADQLQNLINVANTYDTNVANLTKTTDQYQAQIDSLNASYQAAIDQANQYGLATDKLSAAQADAVQKVRDAQQVAIQSAENAVQQAYDQAQGGGGAAEALKQMDIGKQPALDQLKTQLESLGVTADDVTKYVQMLSDALDLQRKNAAEAIVQQTTATALQEQVDAATARGQTYQAQVIKQQIDSTAALKTLSDNLTALGLSANDTAVWVNDLKAALDQQAQAAAAARDESIRQLTVNAQLELLAAQGVNDPAIKAQSDMAALIERQYEDAQKLATQLQALGATSDQVTQAVQYLSAAQKQERDNLQATTQATVTATNTAGQSIQAYIDKLNATPAGGASPQNQLAAAKEIFGQQLTLAQGGDQTALGNITSNADALLQAAKSMYGSTGGYQDVVAFVKESLTGLPATENYLKEILQQLKDMGGSINVDVQLAVIRKITEELNALPADELNKLQVTETILHTIEEQMGRQLSTAEFNHLLAVQGMDDTVIQTIDQIMNGMTPDQFAQVVSIAQMPAADTNTQTVDQNLNGLTGNQQTQIGNIAGLPDDAQFKQDVTQALDGLTISETQLVQYLNDLPNNAAFRQAVSQALDGLTTDEFNQVWALANLPADATKSITQSISTVGDAIIDATSIVKQVEQDVSTNEAIVVHISDTLDNIFQLIYNESVTQTGYLSTLAGGYTGTSGGENVGRGALGLVFPYARGGIFQSPTYSPMALFGEAGPEAIMPLGRDASGRLGVSATPGNKEEGPDVVGAVAEVGIALRDELRLLRSDIQDMRAVLRRAVAQ
jgi:tape measure domain-containing protein